ncbi:MAG: SAM-dependent methyltransferase [Caldilinea sp. CFX5]|nr:SAM-dependent methyltransferase [Caldilinea sp. CFX5]
MSTQTTATVTTHQPSPHEIVLSTALSYLSARALHVAADLGIADHLKDGPRGIDDLASATGAHAPSLYRLLRTLAGQGIFAETTPGHFGLTLAAAVLQRGIPGSVYDAVRMIGDMTGDGPWWSAVGHLRHSVMTGQPGWDYVVDAPFFDYLALNPKAGAWFDRGLANFTIVENAAIAQAYDFSGARRVIDIGGGQGGFLAEILKAFPQVQGVLCDQPQVLAEPAYLTQDGLLNRCDLVGIDFFQSVPSSGDVYLLKRILHDWNDEHSVQILRNCRAAMHKEARLLVVDVVLPPGNTFHPGKIMDMLMMALLEGQERSEEEFCALYRQAALQVTRVIPTPSMLSIVEGVAV